MNSLSLSKEAKHHQSCLKYRVVQKKRTVLLSTSLVWPAVAGCSRAETFSQLSFISFALLLNPVRFVGHTLSNWTQISKYVPPLLKSRGGKHKCHKSSNHRPHQARVRQNVGGREGQTHLSALYRAWFQRAWRRLPL